MTTPDVEQLIISRTNPSSLGGAALRSVHLRLLKNAVDTGYLSLSHRDSAIGEAALLASATREVEKRRSRDCSWIMTLIKRSRCQVWVEHNRQVREFERLLLMKASRNISDEDGD